MAKENYSQYTDEELLNRYMETGETGCWGMLYNRYIPLIYGLCLKYLNDRERAKDAVMDIYEMLSGKIMEYNINHFKSWVYTVSKNHCHHLLKEKKKSISFENEEVFVENEDFYTLMDEPQNEEEMKALEYCMQMLSKEQRISIQYFYMESKSYADIANQTGYTMNKVKSYIQNGKRNLKLCIVDKLTN